MDEPFSVILPRGERLVAAAECETSITTGPLAGLGEMLAFFSPVLSLILVARLDGWPLKIVGAVAPPLILILLARTVLRRWKRPRAWIGVTSERVLLWRRPAALSAQPRVESVPLADITEVAIEADAWDQRHGAGRITLLLANGSRDLGRVRAPEALRDAILVATPPHTMMFQGEQPSDFVPPAPAPDYRPEEPSGRWR